ncbi:hypothetical protein AB0D37_06730 [Streptomyces sp. NPDC048384]|uniref:hypothetical protein n=1 Tax=Streptomyces sp. NPDC048384 TaxID=3155487 RepID=UPI0034380C2A
MLTCPTGQCDDPTFDMCTTAYLSFDVDTDPMQATADLTGLSEQDVVVSCAGCGHEVESTRDLNVAQVVALVRVHKRHAMSLPMFSSYDLEGTVIDPASIKETPLRDVTGGSAYEKAAAYLMQWEKTDQYLRDAEGVVTDEIIHDRRRGEWEHGLGEIFESLMSELAA